MALLPLEQKIRERIGHRRWQQLQRWQCADAWNYGALVTNKQVNASFFGYIDGFNDVAPATGAPKAQTMSGLKVVDDNTFTVALSQKFSTWPQTLGDRDYPLPKAFFSNHAGYLNQPIGNGPYEIASWTRSQKMQLRPNPQYSGTIKPQNGGIDLKVYTDTNAAYADLQSGNLDIDNGVPNSALKTIQSDLNAVDGSSLRVRCPTSFDIADVPSLHQRYHNARAGLRNLAKRIGRAHVPRRAGISFLRQPRCVSRVKPGHLGRMGSASVRHSRSSGARLRQLPAAPTKQAERSRRSTPTSPNSGDAARASRPEGPDDPGAGPTSGRRRLSKPDCLYSWPEARFAVTHTRWKPYPRIGNARISAGALGNERPCRVLR